MSILCCNRLQSLEDTINIPGKHMLARADRGVIEHGAIRALDLQPLSTRAQSCEIYFYISLYEYIYE
jgi:hypothetical protein